MSKFALVLLSLMTAPNSDAELLFFTSDNCQYCHQVAPIVDAMAADGYPIRTVNISESPSWQRQFNITSVPCFIMMSNGDIVDRVNGATTHQRLIQMFQRTSFGQSDFETRQASALVEHPSDREAAPIATTMQPAEDRLRNIERRSADPNGLIQNASNNANQIMNRALRSTVRLKVQDRIGLSYGTGTIIHTQGDEALILTCGHLFRESQGRGTITVELGFPERAFETAGRLLAYDADTHDVALIVVKPGIQVESMPLALSSYRPIEGDQIFSVGCDEGRDPTIRQTRVKALTTYSGVVKIDTYGRPIDGRSGGGLFTSGGQLIGVCNAAAVKIDEGIYAGVQSIHWQLETVGLSDHVLDATRLASRQPDQHRLLNERTANTDRTVQDVSRGQSAVVSTTPSIDATNVGTVRPVGDREAIEVICIVRSSNDPSRTQTVVVRNPSAELLRMLEQHAQTADPQSRIPGNSISPPSRHIATQNTNWDGYRAPADDNGLRAQSPR